MFYIDRQMFRPDRLYPVSAEERARFENDPRVAEWEAICHDRRVRYWISARSDGRPLRYVVRSRYALTAIASFKTLDKAVARAEELLRDEG